MATPGYILAATNPTGTVYSDYVSMKKASLFSLQIEHGALTGILTLWCSNKSSPDITSDADWVQNTDVTFSAVSGAGGQFINAGNAAARYYRVKYVHTSGTGAINIWSYAGEA